MKYSLLLLLLFSSIAIAAGGKVRDANPIIGDGCVYQIPPGLDISQCELIPAPNQAGVQVYACDLDVIVFCADEEDDVPRGKN
jgi:hypothetical protein